MPKRKPSRNCFGRGMSPAGFEPTAFRLGEPLNICHLCSPMYRKAFIRQAFFVFRVAPCSSEFTDVVRCSSVHFSSFLDVSKKGNKNIFHLPPILALFRAKTHLQSNRESKQNISHLPEKYSLGKMIKKSIASPIRMKSEFTMPCQKKKKTTGKAGILWIQESRLVGSLSCMSGLTDRSLQHVTWRWIYAACFISTIPSLCQVDSIIKCAPDPVGRICQCGHACAPSIC